MSAPKWSGEGTHCPRTGLVLEDCDCGLDVCDTEQWDALRDLRARLEAAEAAILDIDAHASPLGEDEDGFVSVGYLISVGSLHRALGLVGHSAAPAADAETTVISQKKDLQASAAEVARLTALAKELAAALREACLILVDPDNWDGSSWDGDGESLGIRPLLARPDVQALLAGAEADGEA